MRSLTRFLIAFLVSGSGCLLGSADQTLQAKFQDSKNGPAASRFYQKAPSLFGSRSRSFGDGGTPVQLRELIKPLLEVRCQLNDFTVLLHYERRYARMTKLMLNSVRKAEIWAGRGNSSAGEEGCTGSVEPSEGSIVLKFGIGDCATEADLGTDNGTTVTYNTQLMVKMSFNGLIGSDEALQYQVQCIHPAQEGNEQMTVRQSLRLFGSRETANTPWTYPQTLTLGREVWLQSTAELSWYSQPDMYSFPVMCWTSQSPSESQSQKLYFVNEGCQVNDEEGGGLSSVHSIDLGPSRVRFSLGGRLIFGLTDNPLIYVHCHVIPCLQNYTKGLLNIPRCPKTRYCAGRPDESHFLPEYLRDVSRTGVYAGPLLLKSHRRSISNVDAMVKCQNSCPEVIVEKEFVGGTRGADPKARTTTVYHGVSLTMTAVVAISSLLIGMGLMGSLWFLHNKTNPKKQMGNVLMRQGTRTPPSLCAHPLTTVNNHLLSDKGNPSATNLVLNPIT